MGFLWTLIIGLVVGAIAKLLMPGKDPGGFIITMLLGVAGALLAGFIGRALGWYSDPGTGPRDHRLDHRRDAAVAAVPAVRGAADDCALTGSAGRRKGEGGVRRVPVEHPLRFSPFRS